MKEKIGKINIPAAGLGAGIGTVCMVVSCAAGAGLMAKGIVDVDLMNIWAAGILAGGGLLCALAARLAGGGPLEAALACAAETVVLMAVNLVLNDGKMERIGAVMLAIGGGCGAGILLMLRKGTAGTRRRRRR